MDVQVGWHDPTAHAQGFFPAGRGKQMIVMSLGNVTVITLM